LLCPDAWLAARCSASTHASSSAERSRAGTGVAELTHEAPTRLACRGKSDQTSANGRLPRATAAATQAFEQAGSRNPEKGSLPCHGIGEQSKKAARRKVRGSATAIMLDLRIRNGRRRRASAYPDARGNERPPIVRYPLPADTRGGRGFMTRLNERILNLASALGSAPGASLRSGRSPDLAPS
jgi:hypothetical protein